MKFATLTYNANQPTVQQVNIPTNTDYKIGMKVTRNGKVSNIAPSEFTVTATDGTTVPVDAEKTNNYVTITRSSGDDASYEQFNLRLDHGYDFNDYVKQTGVMDSTNFYNFPETITVESLGIGGYELTMDNIKWGSLKQPGGPVDVDDITTWYTPSVWPGQMHLFKWPNGVTAVLATRAGFGIFDEDGNLTSDAVSKVVLNPAWHMTFSNQGFRGTVGNYYVIAIKMALGTPYSADFKLNVNTFKSQHGDVAEFGGRANVVKVGGTYSDGTEFSYDFMIK